MRQTDHSAVMALTHRPWNLSHTADGTMILSGYNPCLW